MATPSFRLRLLASTIAMLPLLLCHSAFAHSDRDLKWGPFPINGLQVRNSDTLPVRQDGSSPSRATGAAEFYFHARANKLDVRLTWENLETPLTKIHVHGPAGPDESTDQHLFDILLDEAATAAAGVNRTSGSYTTRISLDAISACPIHANMVSASHNEDLVDVLASGHAYINVHTVGYPKGEIRGDVPRPRPEDPTNWTVMLVASVAIIPPLIWWERRRNRQKNPRPGIAATDLPL
jgi:hypothetical protein